MRGAKRVLITVAAIAVLVEQNIILTNILATLLPMVRAAYKVYGIDLPL